MYLSSAAVAYPLNRFDALCVQRCSSAYHCCNVWLFALLSPVGFNQFDPSLLTSLINNTFLVFSHQTLEIVLHVNHTNRVA